jgi:hypothetical protein
MRRLTTGIGEGCFLHEIQELLKRELFSDQILNGKRFDLGSGVPDTEAVHESVNVQGHVLAVPLSADIVWFQINVHAAITAYPAHVAVAIYGS